MEENKNKYWLHRISHEWEVSYALMEKGYLSLGWFDFSKTQILDAARNNDVKRFEDIYDSIEKSKKYRSRWDMWHFANFNVEDIIVVPLFNGKFSVCKVLEVAKPISEIQNTLASFEDVNGETISWDDGVLKRGSNTIRIGFVIKVEFIKKNLKRSEYADSALTSRMKMRQTNGNISDLKANVEAVIEAKKAINFYENAIEDASKKLLKRIQRDLNDNKFELLVKAYMDKIGSDNTYLPPKNEHGKKDYADADVIAVFKTLKVTVQIQAKHHKKITGDWAVQQIKGYIEQLEDKDSELSHKEEDDYLNIPWVVSSCEDYSEEAKTLALDNGVRLINGLEFSRMLIDAGLSKIDV